MPPLPPVPGVLKVQLFYDIAGYGAVNILHFSYSGGPPSAADCATLATEIRAGFNASLPAAMSTTVALVATVVTDLSSAMGASGQDLTTSVGVINTPVVANQVATVVKWPVSLRYRGGHPKTFWPSLPATAAADQSRWTDPEATNWASLVNDFIAACLLFFAGSTTITGHVAVSYFHAHAVRPVPLVLSLGAGVCNPKFGSMRRRRLQPVTI